MFQFDCNNFYIRSISWSAVGCQSDAFVYEAGSIIKNKMKKV